MEYLCRRYRRKDLIVIWDGATIHRSQAIKEFLARKKGRVHLVDLPGYSPERTAATVESGRVAMESVKKEFKNRVFLSLADLAELVKEKIEEVQERR